MSLRDALKIKNIAVIILFLIPFYTNIFAAPCTPASAQLCAAVDDISQIYINGVLITNTALSDFPDGGGPVVDSAFPYCDVGDGSCSPLCISLSPAQLALLQPTGNVISVRTLNTGYNELWVSYSLEVTCASGAKSYVTSADTANIKMYYDSGCPVGDIPSYSGRTWYDPLYDWASSGLSWVAPSLEQGQKFGKRIYDPQTGSVLPALSYSSDSDTQNNDCKEIFTRQGFDLPEEPTPVPPAFTIAKSASQTTNIGQTSPHQLTFTLNICNTGGGTFGNQVVINDTWSSSGGSQSWQYQGPWSYTDTILGAINVSTSGENLTLTFANGFPNNTCYPFSYWVRYGNGTTDIPPYCDNWNNTANLAYLASPTIVTTLPLSNYCPPPPSFTITKTANTSTVSAGSYTTFTLALCNTSGVAWNGSLYLTDNFSSAPGPSSSWQFNPLSGWYWDNPATGIDFIQANNTSDRVKTFEVRFQQPGFTGCVDIPFTLQAGTGSNWGCGPWHNDVFLSYFGSPTAVSTVNMLNYCSPTPTITLTRTPTATRTITETATQTRTRTITATVTQTRTVGVTLTITMTATRTVTATPTITRTATPVQPNIQLTKTEDRTIMMLGETIQYCLNYTNSGAAPATFNIWDTIPDPMDFVSCTGGCSQVGNILVWTITNLGAGASGSVCFNARAARLPYLQTFEEYLAAINSGRRYAYDICENRKWKVLIE